MPPYILVWIGRYLNTRHCELRPSVRAGRSWGNSKTSTKHFGVGVGVGIGVGLVGGKGDDVSIKSDPDTDTDPERHRISPRFAGQAKATPSRRGRLVDKPGETVTE
jgi:hypothetical protein